MAPWSVSAPVPRIPWPADRRVAAPSNVILSREITVEFSPNAKEGNRMRGVVLDDPVGELVLAAEELGDQPELGPLVHRLTVQTLRLDHPRIPMLSCREVAEVGKYVLAGLLDVGRCSVVGHQDSPSGIEVDAVGTDASANR